jgi:hypothetical protein
MPRADPRLNDVPDRVADSLANVSRLRNGQYNFVQPVAKRVDYVARELLGANLSLDDVGVKAA